MTFKRTYKEAETYASQHGILIHRMIGKKDARERKYVIRYPLFKEGYKRPVAWGKLEVKHSIDLYSAVNRLLENDTYRKACINYVDGL
jgi:hypothetical protein